MTAVLHGLHICGNILSTDNFSVLVFRCTACELDFEQLRLFVKHLRSNHHNKKESTEQFRDVLSINANKLEEGLHEEELIFPTDYLQQLQELPPDNKDEVDLLQSDGEAAAATDNDADEDWKPPTIEVKSELEVEEPEYPSDFEWAEDNEDDFAIKKTNKNDEDLGKSTTKKLKTFYFDLAKPEYVDISLYFLKLFEDRPCLWNTTVKSRYGTKAERVAARKDMILQLQEKGYKIKDKTVERHIRNILRDHKEAQQKGDQLDEAAKLVLENYKFLSNPQPVVEEPAAKKICKRKMRKRTKLLKTCSDDSADEEEEDEPVVVKVKKIETKSPNKKAKSLEKPLTVDSKAKSKEPAAESQADNSDDDSEANECSDDSDDGSLKSATGPEIVESVTISNRNNVQLPYKRIRFQLLGPIGSDYIDLLRGEPTVWDYANPQYRKTTERKAIIEKWIPHFQQKHNVTFSYHDLNGNWINLRRFYAKHMTSNHKRLSAGSLALLERLSFLAVRNKKIRIKCEHCPSYVMGERSYQNHLYVKHGIGECQYKCDQCGGREFNCASELKQHMKQSHPEGEPEFGCGFCERRFTQLGNMLRHQQMHTGIIMNFVCSTCGQSFRRKANLDAHEVRIHLRQRNFACSMCPKAFYTKGLLQDHINAHLNIRNHKCPTCDKGFHSSHALMRHKQIHTEVKRYACKLCDARFHQFVGLNAHMKNRHQYVNKQDADMEVEPVVPVVHCRYRLD